MRNSILTILIALVMLPLTATAQSASREQLLMNYKVVPVETEGDSYTEVSVSYIQPAKIPAQFEVRFSIWQEEDCLHPTMKVQNGKGINIDWSRLKCVLLNVDKEQPEPVGGYSMDEDRLWTLPYYAVRRTNKQPFKVRFSPDAFAPKIKGDVSKFLTDNHLKSFCAHTFLRVDIYDLSGRLITTRPTLNPPAAASCWKADEWIPSSIQADPKKEVFILGDLGDGPALGPVKIGWRTKDVPQRVEGLYDRWERKVEREEGLEPREYVTLRYYKGSQQVLESDVIRDTIVSFNVLPAATNVIAANGVRMGSTVSDYQRRFGNPVWVVTPQIGKAETFYQDEFTFYTDIKYSYSRVDGANVKKFKPGAIINRIEYDPAKDKIKHVAPPSSPSTRHPKPSAQSPSRDSTDRRKIIPVPAPKPERDTIQQHAVAGNEFNIFEFVQRMLEINDFEKVRQQAIDNGFAQGSSSKTSFYGQNQNNEFFSIGRLFKKDTKLYRLEITVSKREDSNIDQELRRMGYTKTKAWEEELVGKPVYITEYRHESGKYTATLRKRMGVIDWVRTVNYKINE